jgi:hypothetical protein
MTLKQATSMAIAMQQVNNQIAMAMQQVNNQIAVSKQRLYKHVPAEMNLHATIEERYF